MEIDIKVKNEIQKLLSLRCQEKDSIKLIEELGYRIITNKPDEMFYLLRTKVYKKMKLFFIGKFSKKPELEKLGFYHDEWLLPIGREDELHDMLENEYYKEK